MQVKKDNKIRFLKKVLRFIISVIFNLFFNVKITGLNNIPKGEKVIIAPNHFSWLDPLLISHCYKPDVNAIGKIELNSNFFFKFIMNISDSISIDRDANDIKAIKLCIDSLKKRSLILFPEGTRNKDIIPLEAKAGVSMIAARANVKILPVTIKGRFKLFSKVECIFHKSVDINDFKFERLNSSAYKHIGNSILEIIYKPIQGDLNED